MSDSIDIFQSGTTWLKADFHLHTRADKEFAYKSNENEFVQDYICALKAADIRVGVITNHNKFDIKEFKELRKKALKEKIYLLPGVEFSLKDGSRGIHVLIVFSDEWFDNNENVNYIQNFLTSAFTGISNFSSPPYPNSRFGLKETYELLNQFNLDYFFILAHVDDTNGLFHELSGRNLKAFVKQEAFQKVLAIQKSQNIQNYNNLCTLAGKKIACVEGTDNAQSGLKAVTDNSRVCYIKLGDYSFDAIKFALLTYEYNRVKAKDKPIFKNSYIKSIRFEGGLLHNQTIYFSPELNNLIGIRGSGKSAIIESIRYALNMPFTDTTVDKEYKDALVKYVLGSGGKVIIEIVNKHGEAYRIEKILGQKEDIYKNNVLQTGITVDAIYEKLVYFGQKDLSNKDANFEFDLIKRLIGNKLEIIQNDIEKNKREIKEIIFKLLQLQNITEQKKETNIIIENAKHQIEYFKKNGIEVKLKIQTEYEKDLSILTSKFQEINDFINDFDELLKTNNDCFQNTHTLSSSNKKYQQHIEEIFSYLKNELNTLQNSESNIKTYLKEFKDIIDQINLDKESLKEDFARIRRELNIPEVNPDRFIELTRIIQTNELKLKEIEKLEQEKDSVHKSLLQKLTEINNLWHEEFKILKNEIDKINQNQSKLKIEISYKGQREQFIEYLKSYFKGSNIRENVYQEIAAHYSDFIEIYKNEEILKKILNERQFIEFKKKFEENLYDLLTCRIKDKIIIKYNEKELSKHSLGQRASALLLFLLSQKEQNILIIDQPEDDLDNQTIYEDVIKEIIKLKGTMQFIFATHNANIPVLGDSEKVIACEYNENKIDLEQGSIDTLNMQKLIVKIMEGGSEAFKMRKTIYTLWKPLKGI
ncbi:MAG TPA: hypothetical protein PLB48_11065 [Treponema sp.]|jgi:hypothetical protein|nr:hypothetical protein [Treponema sp.]HPC72337.1 hypothetical protein [Treponema sp.]HRS03676.1 hypothetical protein [Treponema sp.]HRU29492.1 hypothetical protein [Treponema sp.]